MALTEYHELLEECLKLQAQIKMNPPESYPFVVCLPGTFRAYFNIK